MKKMAIVAALLTAASLHPCAAAASRAVSVDRDIVIYGSTPAALSAAVQAKRMGRSAVIVCPETRIGGLTTGGLGATDIGNKAAFGGIALDFYKDVAKYYGNPDHLVVQFSNEKMRKATSAGILKSESKWTFEPSVALSILEGWEKRDGLDIRRNEWLDRKNGVEKKDGRIVSIKTLSGSVYSGKVFIDATYEGDLMAAAGVSYHVGREANSVYGETLNGNEPGQAKFHQLHKGIDPYVKPGDPTSGLLPCVEPYDPNFKPGDGDARVQAYCRGNVVAPRPIAMGAYTMDSHHVRRYVTAEGYVLNEGDVEVGTGGRLRAPAIRRSSPTPSTSSRRSRPPSPTASTPSAPASPMH